MAGFLDGHTIRILCPSCGRKNTQTIGWIKTHEKMPCAGCQAFIMLHSAECLSEITRIEKMLDDFARDIGKH